MTLDGEFYPEPMTKTIDLANDLVNQSIQPRPIMKYFTIFVVILNLVLVLDILFFKTRPWPYSDGGGSDLIYVQSSLLFDQFASHCLYLRPNGFGNLIILTIPFLSFFVTKNYLWVNQPSSFTTQSIRRRVLEKWVVALFIAGPYSMHLILLTKYRQVSQPGYFPPLEAFIGIMIFVLLPVVLLLSSIIVQKSKFSVFSNIMVVIGSILYLFGYVLFNFTLCL